MKCSNCRQNEATVKFLQVINGEKTELFLCESCAEEMGIDNMDFTLPMDFSSFISEFFDSFGEQELLSALTETKLQKCNNCGLSYDEFVKTGKLGCTDCYDVFKDRIDLITKNIQGSSEHKGKRVRKSGSEIISNKLEKFYGEVNDKNMENVDSAQKISNQDVKEKINENEQIEILKMKLKKAVKEENYEEAAEIRDEIKKLQE